MININVKRLAAGNWAVYANGEMVESGYGSKADAVRAAAEMSRSVGSNMSAVDAALLAELGAL